MKQAYVRMLQKKRLAKGQFFSKGLIGILGFSQKTNERTQTAFRDAKRR